MKMHAVRCALSAAVILASALAAAPARADDVARGKYLVTRMGMCADCHGAKYEGTYLGFLAPHMPVAYRAPKIAGLPMFKTDAAAATFFMTGKMPAGKKPPRPPMPGYRMNADDARAVVAYLRSLK